jgi:ureidoacrylate peracid hydrolase
VISPPRARAVTSEDPIAGNKGRETTREVLVTFDAKPAPVEIDIAKTAVIVVDMQNDFGAKGGMLDRAGFDISVIQKAIGPTARVLAAARHAGIKIIYVKSLLSQR